MSRVRFVPVVAVIAAGTGTAPPVFAAAVPPPPVVTKADYIAGRLARDPVFVSDHVPREVSAADAARLRAAVRRMPAPTYLAVVAEARTDDDPLADPKRLIPLLHDKLSRPGVYVVVPANGIGVDVAQFGTHLPVDPAAQEVTFSQPYNAGVVRVVERFVDNVRSGRAQQRNDEAYAKSRAGRRPKPYKEPSDLIDEAQRAGAISGLAIAVLGAAWIAWRRSARRGH